LFFLHSLLAPGAAADEALAGVVATGVEDAMARPDPHPPMWPEALSPPRTLICAHTSFDVPELSIQNGGWQILADDPKRAKFGFLAYGRNTSQALAFSWANAGVTRSRPGGATLVMLGYLKSYDPVMGRMTASCSGGCECEEVDIDGGDRAAKSSVTDFVRIPLTALGEGCTLTVAPAGDNGDSAKMKVSALVVLTCDGAACAALDYLSPKFLPPHKPR
jgi:hypothetical protein